MNVRNLENGIRQNVNWREDDDEEEYNDLSQIRFYRDKQLIFLEFRIRFIQMRTKEIRKSAD